jgi:succinate dehydrogenase/fumarate reductase cytochrome b subunit
LVLSFRKIGGFRQDLEMNANAGAVSFYLHRLSGVVLTVALFPLLFVFRSRQLYGLEGPLLTGGWEVVRALLDFILCALLAFHFLNGLRLLVVEFFGLHGSQQAVTLISYILFFITVVFLVFFSLPGTV